VGKRIGDGVGISGDVGIVGVGIEGVGVEDVGIEGVGIGDVGMGGDGGSSSVSVDFSRWSTSGIMYFAASDS
jgi:hypothetical protein